LVDLGKDLNIESIISALSDKKVNKKTKQKILLLLGIPFEGEIERVLRLPEVKEIINKNKHLVKEAIKEVKEEEFEEELIKKYLKEIENYLVGIKSEKEVKKTGITERKVNYQPSKKFYVKETIKSFIKKENKFYSKLNKEYKKENVAFLLDFSSSMIGEKIKALKKYMLYYWLKYEKKVKRVFIFSNEVEEIRNIKDLIKKTPKGLTNIAKALSEIAKQIDNSVVYLITDNIPTVGEEKKILKAVEELKLKRNHLIVILLKPKEESIKLAKKMSDKVLVLEGNYFRSLIEYL